MLISLPALLGLLVQLSGATAQNWNDGEMGEIGLLQARDNYVIARDEYLQARSMYDVDDYQRDLQKRQDNDDYASGMLMPRADCPRCGNRMSSTGCGRCRAEDARRRREELEEQRKQEEAARAIQALAEEDRRMKEERERGAKRKHRRSL
ncbi:MAG: hypothetical protein GOMPHAMPRED_006690 [Gomphillus americanus]|uniref:Uncharacterized protein n=1 Tax=Gomphillus americanus TaxID=1940652 RepID=A0A8H3FXN1_9LECA|nr:MAG: hypothetical protein GOMPHAMPRED_006690 [Gomphillus americanus]